jgi:nucleoside-diphosphate-sugar epimerase
VLDAKTACAVTGASGYVGSRLAKALAPHFDVVPMGSRVGPEGIRWSLTAADAFDELSERGVKVLVHAAWDMKEVSPARNRRTNVDGSRTLLESAVKAGVEKIVFISSMSCFPEARSEYGRSKLAVEQLVLAAGGTVIRPGLVWGANPGGIFGSIRKQVSKGGRVPIIGNGKYPQYMVHEDDLAATVVRVLLEEQHEKLIAAAHPKPWMFRDLVTGIAAKEGKQVSLIEVPWWAIYGGLKAAETVGLKLGFRSDSVLGLVYQNRAPAFSSLPFRLFDFKEITWDSPCL